jgi:hypothetical protein
LAVPLTDIGSTNKLNFFETAFGIIFARVLFPIAKLAESEKSFACLLSAFWQKKTAS